MIECSLTLQRQQTYVYITKNKWMKNTISDKNGDASPRQQKRPSTFSWVR